MLDRLCNLVKSNCVRPNVTRDMTPFELSNVMLILKSIGDLSLPKGSH